MRVFFNVTHACTCTLKRHHDSAWRVNLCECVCTPFKSIRVHMPSTPVVQGKQRRAHHCHQPPRQRQGTLQLCVHMQRSLCPRPTSFWRRQCLVNAVHVCMMRCMRGVSSPVSSRRPARVFCLPHNCTDALRRRCKERRGAGCIRRVHGKFIAQPQSTLSLAMRLVTAVLVVAFPVCRHGANGMCTR